MSSYANGTKVCSNCRKPEYCFLKVYKKNLKEVICSNEFWVCQNADCFFYIEISQGKEINIWIDKETFYYKIGYLTELNLKANEMSEMHISA